MTLTDELLTGLVAIEGVRLAIYLYDRARCAWLRSEIRRATAPKRKRQL